MSHKFIPVMLLTAVLIGFLGIASVVLAEENRESAQKLYEQKREMLKKAEEIKKKADEQKKELQQKIKEQKAEYRGDLSKLKNNIASPAGLKANIQKEGKKGEMEIETANGQKIKTKVEDDGTTKIEVEGGSKISAFSRFPLSIDPLTHQLIVTTPAGRKVVAVLPDQAIQNMLTRNIINKINIASSGATASAELQERNSEPVYKIKGEKKYKVFGFIPVFMPVTTFVSAQSGNLVSQDQPLLSNIIKLFSSQ